MCRGQIQEPDLRGPDARLRWGVGSERAILEGMKHLGAEGCHDFRSMRDREAFQSGSCSNQCNPGKVRLLEGTAPRKGVWRFIVHRASNVYTAEDAKQVTVQALMERCGVAVLTFRTQFTISTSAATISTTARLVPIHHDEHVHAAT